MTDILDLLDLKVVKKLSETRWYARHDTVIVLYLTVTVILNFPS